MLRLMMMLLAAASVGMWTLAATAADGAAIDDFVGRWTGDAVQTPGQPLDAEVIGIEISKSADGFNLSWHDLARNDQGKVDQSLLTADFVRTGRPGIFEFAPKASSFLDRMFASPATGNPLAGDTIIWARIDVGILAVYSLTIASDGSFDLNHYSWTRTDQSLDLRYQEKTEEAGEVFLIEGRLVPAKG